MNRFPTKSLTCGLLLVLALGMWWRATRVELPSLVDAVDTTPRNLMGDETSLYWYMLGNYGELAHMPKKLPSRAQDALEGRMEDIKLRWELRMLYAVVLANQGNQKAQEFIIDQYKRADDARVPEVMQAIYWVWRMHWQDDGQEGDPMSPDMKWAEDTMLAALSDKRICTVDTPLGGDFYLRDLAVHFGNFHIILAAQKSKKAVPVLSGYITEELSRAPENDLFPSTDFDDGAGNVVGSLAEWDDAAIEPVMLEVVRCAVQKQTDEWALSYAMDWLVRRKNDAVIHFAKDGLGLDHILSSLEGSRHEPYLKAIRGKLVDLQDGDLTDSELYRQRVARASAELILIMGEEEDPVPKLMEFVENAANKNRKDAIYQLREMKDPRCIAWAEKVVRVEQDWFVPFCLIELIGKIPGDDATVSLVNLLDFPFDKILPADGINYTARDYHDQIKGALEERTGKKLGTDSAAWRKWLRDKGNDVSKNSARD